MKQYFNEFVDKYVAYVKSNPVFFATGVFGGFLVGLIF